MSELTALRASAHYAPAMDRLSTARPILLAATGGVLHFLGFVGFGIWPLALICLVPLWAALEMVRDRLGRALLVGFTFGWVSYAGGYLWLWQIVDVFLRGNLLLGAVVWLLDSAYFAARYALYAGLYVLMRRRQWPVAVAGVPSLIAVEWLYPLLFPVHLGHAFAAHLTLIQISDLGGPLLLTAVAALLNAAVFSVWRSAFGTLRSGADPSIGDRWTRRATYAAAVLALLGTWIYGVARMAQVDGAAAAAPHLRVGIVQGNLGVQEKGAQAARDHKRYLEQSRELLAGGPLDLMVWPETVHTRGLRGPLPISGQLVREDLAVPLLFGAAFIRADDDGRRAFNSALLVGADGVIRSGYDKNLLIPFTEYVPFAGLFPSLLERFDTASHFNAASETPPLVLGEWRLATPICYEAVRPAFLRRMMREARPHLLVTLANDAWFGDSQGPWLHLAMAKLRAIENRRYLVRATNSGVSAIVDANGREIARAGLLRRENLRATVAMLDETTVYTRWGDWLGWLAAGVVLAALCRRRRLRQRATH